MRYPLALYLINFRRVGFIVKNRSRGRPDLVENGSKKHNQRFTTDQRDFVTGSFVIARELQKNLIMHLDYKPDNFGLFSLPCGGMGALSLAAPHQRLGVFDGDGCQVFLEETSGGEKCPILPFTG